MNNELKSISYAFISNGVQIYLEDGSDSFLISQLVCNDCGWPWYMNLTECFICGSINSFIYRCTKCGNFQSITNSTGICSFCGSDSLIMECLNEHCLSNTDKEIFKEIAEYGGVFNRQSGFSISQQYCLNCGSQLHHYLTYKIYVKVIQDDSITIELTDGLLHEKSSNSYLLLKRKGEPIKYYVGKLNDIIGQTITVNEMTSNFKEIVDQLYPSNRRHLDIECRDGND
ncbi:MAG: hypothetical protein ACP5OE_09555 [Thermodesulfobium sp.]